MKSRIAIILMGLAVFSSAVHAPQRGNCCDIQVGGANISGNQPTLKHAALGHCRPALPGAQRNMGACWQHF